MNGMGIFAESCSLNIQNSIFKNMSGKYGPAIFSDNEVSLTSNHFSDIYSSESGGVFISKA